MTPCTRQILSRNVRQLRLQHGWSQEQLAERCGLHRTYIGAIERGERNLGLDNLDRLARALNTTASTMLEDSGSIAFHHRIGETRTPYTIAHTHTWHTA